MPPLKTSLQTEEPAMSWHHTKNNGRLQCKRSLVVVLFLKKTLTLKKSVFIGLQLFCPLRSRLQQIA